MYADQTPPLGNATSTATLGDQLSTLLNSIDTLTDRAGKLADNVVGFRPSPLPPSNNLKVEQRPHLLLLVQRLRSAVERCENELGCLESSL